MKNLSGFASLMLTALVPFFALCFGGVREARASIGGSVEFGGFSVTYAGTENPNPQEGDPYSDFFVHLGSSSNTIDKVFASFCTVTEDTSYGVARLSVTGTRNMVPTGSLSISTGTFLNFGDIYITQSSYIDTQGGQSFANVSTGISHFDLWSCYLNYYEYESFDGEVPITRYTFVLTATGSFGDGPEGDRRGLPFVPTPGTAGILFAASLCFFRGRQMA